MELVKKDLIWCLRRLPKPLFNLMKERGRVLVLAGGFIRSCITNEPVNDIDMFSATKDLAELFARTIADSPDKIIETENAYTVLLPKYHAAQFIHRWVYEWPEDIVPSFDFTIARAAIWYNNNCNQWQSHCDEQYYQDLAAKRLTYCCPVRNEDAGGSILRVLKFYQRGYRIPLDSFGAVIARLIGAVKFENIRGGDGHCEERLTEILTKLLREVDPDVDPTHSAHLPSDKEKEKEDIL